MPESLKRLINILSFLPGFGEKSATKLAFFLLNSNNNYIENFKDALTEIKENIGTCQTCHALVDKGSDFCNFCSDTSRDKNTIFVVEDYLDLLTIEQTSFYKGLYHVLGGAISPMNGVFVGDLKFESLFERVKNTDGKVELILGTNPNIEGEATASYIKNQIENSHLKIKTKISRLSRGLSSGFIEYADNMTLISAIKERKDG